MSIETCGNCKFYNLAEETRHGLLTDKPLHPSDYEAECRRFPPVRVDAEYAGRMAEQEVLCECFGGPIVNAGGWCGEWKAADSQPAMRATGEDEDDEQVDLVAPCAEGDAGMSKPGNGKMPKWDIGKAMQQEVDSARNISRLIDEMVNRVTVIPKRDDKRR